MISDRAKAALQAAKARGTKLGGLRSNSSEIHKIGAAQGRAKRTAAAARICDLRPVIAGIQANGAKSLRQIAAVLNARKIETARGGQWSAVQVQRILV